jgi:hypothetical protein
MKVLKIYEIILITIAVILVFYGLSQRFEIFPGIYESIIVGLISMIGSTKCFIVAMGKNS